MGILTIWAPKAIQVELACQGRRVPMKESSNGYWQLDAPFILHGIDYAFFINGEGPFPDPRSVWQPYGIGAPSRLFDFALFEWSDEGWQPPPLESAIFYELHCGTFTPQGTFDAAIERLPDLRSLGVTHLELMPIVEFSGSRGWGYDGVALYAPHHVYGGPEGLHRFINFAHELGMAVILDVVYNHLGPVGNYLDKFGPYFTDRYATPWGKAINLDGPNSDQVRRYFIDNALFWLKEYHVDGLRLDAVHALFDQSALPFLEQLAQEIDLLEKKEGRRLLLIAESDLNDPRLIRPRSQGGLGLNAQWNEDFHHALHAVLTQEKTGYYQDFGKLADLAKALTKGFVLDGCYSLFRRRRHGRSASKLTANQFISFLQNHDQVGNRHLGERITHLISIDRALIGAAILLTGPFIPLIFQGEEWAASSPFLYFTDYEDHDIRQAVYKGRQEEFPNLPSTSIPNPQAESSFLSSKLPWEERTCAPHARVLAWYQTLILLRRSLPELQEKSLEECKVLFDEENQWLSMQRGSILLVCNFSDQPQLIPSQNRLQLLLSSIDGAVYKNQEIYLPASSAALFRNII